MKRTLTLILLFPLFVFAQKEIVYTADIKASTIHWHAKKTTGEHDGEIKLQSGKLAFNNFTPAGGEFILDMNSIIVSDIKDPKDNKSLVDHLKAEDFFGVAAYPTATLSVIKSESIKSDSVNFNITAELTIKGIKNQIQFPAKINAGRDKATASADFTIDRTKWKIVYKSKSILGSAADKFIYDDIHFSVKLILLKQK